jgi:hypothetical protein
VRLTLRLALRTQAPSYRTPFDEPAQHEQAQHEQDQHEQDQREAAERNTP